MRTTVFYMLMYLLLRVSACMGVFSSAMAFMWTAPLLTYFRSPESVVALTDFEITWVISFIELGNLIGSIPTMYLVDIIGRKWVVLAAGPLFIISWILVLLLPSFGTLLVSRTLQGISMSFVEISGTVYLGEIASDNTRGAITSLFFNFWWVGSIVSYTLGAYLSFKWFTIATMAFNIPFVLLFCWQPESPYFYIYTGHTEKALKSLEHFRDLPQYKLEAEIEETKLAVESYSKKTSSIKDMFATPWDRKAFFILMMISYLRLATGSGGITVYPTEIFLESKNTTISPDSTTIIFGVVMLLGSLFSSFTSDRLGRRALLLISTIGCLVCQIMAGAYFFLLTNTDVYVSNYSWIAPISIFLFSGFCTAGMYPVCVAYTSELFTSQTRGMASTAGSLMITFTSFLLMVIFEPLKNAFGMYSNFLFYTINCLFAAGFFYFMAPETKGKSFAQIREENS